MQISALVPEIFKFEKCVQYANEMTDDVIHSTPYYFKHINRAILANFPEGAVLPIMAYTGRLRSKGVPFSGFRYMKG